MTSLIYAAERGHSDVIRLLLEAGASIEAKTTVSKEYPYAHVCVCLCCILAS